MSFGSQTLTFVTLVGTGAYDPNGFETTTESEVSVTGCHHRPLSAAEAAEAYGNVPRQVWRSTCPPEAAAVLAKSTGKITVDGQTFHIIGGAQPHRDFEELFSVVIDSEIHPE